MGGLGPAAVNAGKRLAAVGAVALPLAYCGCGYPATLGGTGAAGTTGVGNGVLPPNPTSGGGSHVPALPSGKLGGKLSPPETMTGCSIPGAEGGDGAEVIGGSAISDNLRTHRAR